MITKFKQFESSHFHSINDIDEILDKISENGIESLNPADFSILMNYSQDDDIIHDILIKANETAIKLKQMRRNLSVITKNDKEALEKLAKPWMKLNMEMQAYNDTLVHLFRIEDPNDIKSYLQQTGIGNELGDMLAKESKNNK